MLREWSVGPEVKILPVWFFFLITNLLNWLYLVEPNMMVTKTWCLKKSLSQISCSLRWRGWSQMCMLHVAGWDRSPAPQGSRVDRCSSLCHAWTAVCIRGTHIVHHVYCIFIDPTNIYWVPLMWPDIVLSTGDISGNFKSTLRFFSTMMNNAWERGRNNGNLQWWPQGRQSLDSLDCGCPWPHCWGM